MSLVAVVLAVAVLLAVVRGGRLADLADLELRSRRLVLAALAAQVLGAALGGPAHGVGLAVSAGLVVAFLARNRSLAGAGLIALGLAANALVVLANGAMPVSAVAAARAGLSPEELGLADDPRHEPETGATRLAPLGDVLPLPLPVLPQVASPGDVLVAAGLGRLVLSALPPYPARRGRRRTPSRR